MEILYNVYMYLSVIIPAYKEEKVIEATLRSIDSYLKRQAYDYEILVVVDDEVVKKIPVLEPPPLRESEKTDPTIESVLIPEVFVDEEAEIKVTVSDLGSGYQLKVKPDTREVAFRVVDNQVFATGLQAGQADVFLGLYNAQRLDLCIQLVPLRLTVANRN